MRPLEIGEIDYLGSPAMLQIAGVSAFFTGDFLVPDPMDNLMNAHS